MVSVKRRDDGTTVIFGRGPEVDKATAVSAQDFHVGNCRITVGSRGGVTRTSESWRRNGKTQTWKTRPEDFRTPIKYGLYRTGQLTQYNAADCHDSATCPISSITDDKAREMAETARVYDRAIEPAGATTDAAGNDGPTLN